MPNAIRIQATEASEQARRGEATLVCAYEDRAKCDSLRLDGALSMDELRARQSTLPKDRRLLFYCA